jgi:hypothetical protein
MWSQPTALGMTVVLQHLWQICGTLQVCAFQCSSGADSAAVAHDAG